MGLCLGDRSAAEQWESRARLWQLYRLHDSSPERVVRLR